MCDWFVVGVWFACMYVWMVQMNMVRSLVRRCMFHSIAARNCSIDRLDTDDDSDDDGEEDDDGDGDDEVDSDAWCATALRVSHGATDCMCLSRSCTERGVNGGRVYMRMREHNQLRHTCCYRRIITAHALSIPHKQPCTFNSQLTRPKNQSQRSRHFATVQLLQ